MAAPESHELIIIKRMEDEEHEHHSSAWKVAHADFMTAMMAFFLIMWLINATDAEVRTGIAAYFNPMDLAQSVSERRGLEDPEDVKDAGTSEEGEEMTSQQKAAGEKAGPGDDVQQGPREKALFQDPYAVLAEIVADLPPDAPTSADAAIGANGVPGSGSGDAHRDPFDPVYWQMTSNRKALAPTPATRGITARQGQRPDAGAARLDAPVAPDTPVAPAATGPAGAGAAAAAPDAKADAAPDTAATLPAPSKEDGKGDATTTDTARQLERELRAEVASVMGTAPGPRIEVRRTAEGTVISLTDDIDFAMFPIGSAVPNARLVLAMGRIAGTLQARPGDVIIRGHTDARPFRSPSYDNWQLSAARANITHYMLVRGGLDDLRVRKIEGYADRALKNSVDPNAPENRRIEIVLRETPE